MRNSGTGNHVNLPLAWTELAQIAQCKGHIQEGRSNGKHDVEPLSPLTKVKDCFSQCTTTDQGLY